MSRRYDYDESLFRDLHENLARHMLELLRKVAEVDELVAEEVELLDALAARWS